MKVLLLHPPSREVYDKFERKQIDRLPIGLAYITAVAEDSGYETEAVDAEASRLSLSDIDAVISDFKPDVIGTTCTTPLFPMASRILDNAKKIIPNLKTILGGPHINALPGESLSGCGSADYVVYGEGEEAFKELLKCIDDGVEYPKVPGVGYIKENAVILNQSRKLVENLDTIPYPARHKFPLETYQDPDRYNEPYTLMVTSRGCPYKCIFCGSSATWGRKVRFRSADNILGEIDIIVNKFGIRNITFSDDTFTLGKRRILEICEGISSRGYNIEFLCSSRINTIDSERLEALAKTGCKEISFGVESGDADILKRICKNIELDNVKPVFELVKSYGIRVHSSYILGNPGDTHETIKKTIDFAIESGTDAAQFSISTPYPGTPLWQMALKKYKLHDKDFTDFKWYYSVVANLSEVSDDDLINYQRDAYRRFEESKVENLSI